MSRVLLLGSAGRQGTALMSAFDRLNIDVVGVDEGHACQLLHDKWDLVLSCMPYSENIKYGTMCIDKGIRWADLGGHVPSTRELHKRSRGFQRVQSPIATDLGLAPGLIEYLAIRLLDDCSKSIQNLRLYVGGLPAERKNAFGYFPMFSTAGLVNNYIGECLALVNGDIAMITSLGDIEQVTWTLKSKKAETEFESVKLSAANTSGALTIDFLKSLFRFGTKNCSYQTLRYPSHWAIVLSEWFQTKDPDKLEKFIIEQSQEEGPDVVYIAMDLDDEPISFKIDPADELSAMQRATAFPAAAASAVILAGEFDKQPVVTAEDIGLSGKFWDILTDLLPEVVRGD